SADLPECNSDRLGQLRCEQDTDSSSACKSSGWAVVSVGQRVVANLRISPISTDFCTEYVGEGCGVTAGQLVIHSDGSVFLLASWAMTYAASPDTDTDQNSITAVFPPQITTGSMVASESVARGSGMKRAFLVYDFSDETPVMGIVHDSDD